MKENDIIVRIGYGINFFAKVISIGLRSAKVEYLDSRVVSPLNNRDDFGFFKVEPAIPKPGEPSGRLETISLKKLSEFSPYEPEKTYYDFL